MAKKLKVFRTSIGFFELAVAAPSMKAAAEAWGADPDIFRRGFAEQTDDRKAVDATMAAPGVVMRRPVGSDGAFSGKAALPQAPKESRRKQPEPRSPPAESRRAADAKRVETAKREEAAREKAAAERDRDEKRQALERRRREAEAERARKAREQLVAKANAALERARARHDEAMQSLQKRRKELDDDEAREDARWQREQREHREALKQAEA